MSAVRISARLCAASSLVIGGVLAAGPALAHVSISPGEAHAGEYTVATVSIPHGCDGSATTSVTIQIPEQIIKVTPTRNPSWEVTKTMTKLATPIKAEGGDEITERVGTVVYTAKTPLPDGYRDTFALSFQVPDVAGQTLVFPTIQKCVKGETGWVEVAPEGAAEPEHPAPSVKVLAAATPESGVVPTTVDETGAPKGVAYAGLGFGVVGLLVGGVALAGSRRKV